MKRSLLIESNFDTKILCEGEEGAPKNWYIEGVFLQEEVVNRNRRVYPESVMAKEVDAYTNEYVKSKRAVGELIHPESMEVNLDRVSHLIETIKKDGHSYVGRAKILNTPTGQITRGLLEGGVQLGVSSRGSGSVKEDAGVSYVQPDFKIAAIDIVYAPSAPDAFVEGLMESADWVWNTTAEDPEFVESLKEEIQKTSRRSLQEKKLEAFQRFLAKISA